MTVWMCGGSQGMGVPRVLQLLICDSDCEGVSGDGKMLSCNSQPVGQRSLSDTAARCAHLMTVHTLIVSSGILSPSMKQSAYSVFLAAPKPENSRSPPSSRVTNTSLVGCGTLCTGVKSTFRAAGSVHWFDKSNGQEHFRQYHDMDVRTVEKLQHVLSKVILSYCTDK